jgi:hypothetical protein
MKQQYQRPSLPILQNKSVKTAILEQQQQQQQKQQKRRTNRITMNQKTHIMTSLLALQLTMAGLHVTRATTTATTASTTMHTNIATQKQNMNTLSFLFHDKFAFNRIRGGGDLGNEQEEEEEGIEQEDNNNDDCVDEDGNNSNHNHPTSSSSSILESYVQQVSQRDANQNDDGEHIVDHQEHDDDDDDGEGLMKLKKREGALNDPDSDDDDDDDDNDDDSDHHEVYHHDDNYHDDEIGHVDIDVVIPMDDEEVKVDIINLTNDDTPSTTTTIDATTSNHSSETQKLNPFDQALVNAFLPLLYPPPSHDMSSFLANELSPQSIQVDVASRRRLDRRTLYQSLLLEWNTQKKKKNNNKNESNGSSSSSSSKRNFISTELSHQLTSSISLASQPLWRQHVSTYHQEPQEAQVDHEDNNDQSDTDEGVGEEGEKHSISDDDTENETSKVSPVATTTPSRPFYSTGIRLYSTPEEDDDEGEEEEIEEGNNTSNNGMGNGFLPSMWNGEGNNEDSSSKSSSASSSSISSLFNKSLKCTLGMQETIALALAHSYNCGFVLLDDVNLQSVQDVLVKNEELDLDYGSHELKFSSLIAHLIRLANEGKLPNVLTKEDTSGHSSRWKGGRISNRMERDISLGLDDPYDDIAIESMKLMKDEEDIWMTLEEDSDEVHLSTTTPLVLFLRTDASCNILKSKSAVDRLARDCVNEESVHLLILGKGIDATTVQLPSSSSSSSASSISNRSSKRNITKRPSMQPPPSNMGFPPGSNSANNPFFPPPSMPPPQQQQQHNPFADMSNVPPQGSPGAFMPGGNNNNDGNPFGFTQQNINASGVNDPEGSRRFNIFLARTVDKDNAPGIMGAIAPPQVGNLFPQMLAMQARENYLRSQEDGDSEEEIQKHEANMQRWAQLMEQQKEQESEEKGNDENEALPPQFFNASFSTGLPGMPSFNPMSGNNGVATPPPELIQQAIEHAVTDVMQHMTEMSNKSGEQDGDSDDNEIPPHLAKAFAQILSNDNLRRGIAENLARAAPALVDPRCQGVMLSVYVPPPPDHPNRGLMPGQQRMERSSQQSKKISPKRGKSSSLGAPGMGGWLNKILSTSSSTSADVDDEDEEETESDTITVVDGDASNNEGEKADEVTDAKDGMEAFVKNTMSKAAERKLKKRDRNARAAAVAAATAMINQHQHENGNGKKKRKSSSTSNGSQPLSPQQKIEKHLTRLQALCTPVSLKTPSDPVRSRSWNAWAIREHGAIIFRKNRRTLNSILSQRKLKIDMSAGTKGMGSILRQMLSIKDLGCEIDDVITCAVELEASRSQRLHVSNSCVCVANVFRKFLSHHCFAENRRLLKETHLNLLI